MRPSPKKHIRAGGSAKVATSYRQCKNSQVKSRCRARNILKRLMFCSTEPLNPGIIADRVSRYPRGCSGRLGLRAFGHLHGRRHPRRHQYCSLADGCKIAKSLIAKSLIDRVLSIIACLHQRSGGKPKPVNSRGHPYAQAPQGASSAVTAAIFKRRERDRGLERMASC